MKNFIFEYLALFMLQYFILILSSFALYNKFALFKLFLIVLVMLCLFFKFGNKLTA